MCGVFLVSSRRGSGRVYQLAVPTPLSTTSSVKFWNLEIPPINTMASAKYDAEFKELSDALLSVPSTRFDPFHITRDTFESAGYKIGADILIPKREFSGGSRPVLVRIHGGFLVHIPSRNMLVLFC